MAVSTRSTCNVNQFIVQKEDDSSYYYERRDGDHTFIMFEYKLEAKSLANELAVKNKTHLDRKSAICNKKTLSLPKKNISIVDRKVKFKIGDLVWCKFSKSPFWPAIITTENGIAYKTKGSINYCHVTFFGDKISHCWARESSLVEFKRNRPFSLIKFTFPKKKTQNLLFYNSINEIRYFTSCDNVAARLKLLKILKQSYDYGVKFNGFNTKINKSITTSKNVVGDLFRENCLFKACCICFKNGGKLLRCNGSCNGYYHQECPDKDSLIKIINGSTKLVCNSEMDKKFKCTMCSISYQFCLLCYNKNSTTEFLKCSIAKCRRYYHATCLNNNSLVQFICSDYTQPRRFICPVHICSTCIFLSKSYDMLNNFSHENLVNCIRCPTSYHQSGFCIPAGSLILSNRRIICAKHFNLHPVVGKLKSDFIIPLTNVSGNVIKEFSEVNMNWCLLCSGNGDLLRCETCPNSYHLKCLNNDPNLKNFANEYICEHCFDFKYPFYGEIVWVKYAAKDWWPGRILYPHESPDFEVTKQGDEFFVKLFVLNIIQRCRRKTVFSFTEDDRTNIDSNGPISKFDQAVELAANELLKLQNEWNLYNKEIMENIKLHTMYKKIKTNVFTTNEISRCVEQIAESNKPFPCNCNKDMRNPCGRDSSCLNRFTNVECQDEFCNVGHLCENRHFTKHVSRKLELFATERCGWGVRTLEPLKKKDFIIEFVGEVIDVNEFKRRIQFKKEFNERAYYFLIVNSSLYIDAGRKGNLSRFVNHSCKPNCEIQIWYVKNSIKVGLFALEDIKGYDELTFNYEINEHLAECFCGTEQCTGFLRTIKKEKVCKKTTENIKNGKENLKKKFAIMKSKNKIKKNTILNLRRSQRCQNKLLNRQILNEDVFNQNNNNIYTGLKKCKIEPI